ncbi:MAG: polysaccharide biosynthesis/export family protein [Paracoccaceae bacterium]|nr:polysaccharide biosynthesis/export family protein [Paracoccaceae bacterium]MDE3123404.1 polysaccharide biosynthesis/export family protein [Paracoccaceae bacterium]MDE3239453.1 polysaccharide biosynthesis/export family protein [Paracoccaceae bacterium]
MQVFPTKGTRRLALLLIVGAVASCGVPRSGPNKEEIYSSSVQRKGDAFVVQVNDRVTRATSVVPALGFTRDFLNAGVVGPDTIHSGDKLAITVYENVANPLLGAPGQKATVLPSVDVDGQGFIYVPYAGRIRAEGLSPDGLRAEITRKLSAQTPDPQVEVSRVPGDGSTVTVEGSVAVQGVYPITQGTRRLSSMIAKAGGVNIPVDSAEVQVTRAGRSEKVWLNDLYTNPKLDIALRRNDRVYVQKDLRSFTVLGATGSQNRVPFTTQTVSAIEAIAQVGGLSTTLADPTGVFVFRNEPAEIANAVLGRSDLKGAQRMIYVLNLTAPDGMFEARDFMIRDGDTVFVTEAPFVQWQKTLSIFTGTVNGAQALSTATTGNNLSTTLSGH